MSAGFRACMYHHNTLVCIKVVTASIQKSHNLCRVFRGTRYLQEYIYQRSVIASQLFTASLNDHS